jgi:hypothetical protein
MHCPGKDLVDLPFGSLDIAAPVSITASRRRSLRLDLPLGGVTAHVIGAILCLPFVGATAIHHHLGAAMPAEWGD